MKDRIARRREIDKFISTSNQQSAVISHESPIRGEPFPRNPSRFSALLSFFSSPICLWPEFRDTDAP